jgi:hypothetical protein
MRTLSLAVLSFLFVLSAANAQSWTATGSTGAVDESALSIYEVGTASIGYLSTSSSTSSIYVRYNVTCQGDDTPAWTTFEILANNANLTNGVVATLYSVNASNGTVTLLRSIGTTASSSTTTSSTSLPSLSCSTNYYVVEAILSRLSSSAHPVLLGVRLY